MSDNDPTALPTPDSSTPTSEKRPETKEPGIDLQNLLSEIRSLSESGQDPARLWRLRQTLDTLRLQEVNRALAAHHERDLRHVLESEEIEKARQRVMESAVTRTDLTIPELLSLAKSDQKATERERRSLLAQKEELERRLHPGKRRRGQPPLDQHEPDSSSNPKPLSAARLEANRANAQKSSGPRDFEHTRFNAVKHGLTARVAWAGENPQRNEEFSQYAFQRLAPRNSLEEIHAAHLIQSRLREDLLLDVEGKVLTRKPTLRLSQDGQAFPFLHDTDALRELDQLARQVTHLTRLSEKQLVALMTSRKQDWGHQTESAASTTSSEVTGAEPSSGTTAEPKAEPTKPVNRGTLEDCLNESRLVLPGEDGEAYRSLVRGLWSTLGPANLLEGFVANDFIQTEWRLDRIPNIQTVLFQRSSVSASDHYCGFAFGFIHEVQRSQALETLRNYESALHKRSERRFALFHKLRKEGWSDAS